MENWRESLPPELKAHPTFAKFESPADLAKSYAELENWKGNAIRIPGKDAGGDAWNEFTGKLMDRVPNLMVKPDAASEEQMKLFYQTLGVPDKVDGYDIKGIEGLNGDTLERTRTMALAGKLTPAQHKAVSAWLAKEAKETEEHIKQLRAEDGSKLQKHWGDSITQRKQRVDEFIKREAIEPLGEINAAGYLILDKMIDALTGKPQGFDLPANRDIGPDVNELKSQVAEILSRLVREGNTMPPDERKRLNEKRIKLMESISKAEQRAA